MSENKTGKYLKYAIGEIVLVMVGILLALQVNNWNEERLIKKEHLTMLIKLDNELQTNIDRLNFLIGAHTKIMENNLVLNDILLEGIEKKNVEQFLKSLTFQSNNINLQSSTYEQMKNTGKLYTISSDSLVTAIELYYKFCQREDYYIKKLNDDKI